MVGSWFGYVFVLLACGAFVALIGGSTFLLYALAKARRGERRARVVTVSLGGAPGEPLPPSE